MKTNSFDYNKSVSYKDEGMMIKTLKLCFKRKKKNTWIIQNGLFSSVYST